MPRNALLDRGYTDEGCGLYECLLCHERWEDRRSGGWTWCSFCGTRWDEHLVAKWEDIPYRKGKVAQPSHALVVEWFGPQMFDDEPTWHFLLGYLNTEVDLVKLLPSLRKDIKEDVLHVFQPLCDYLEASPASRRAHTRIRVVRVRDFEEELPRDVSVEESCGRFSIRRR